MPNVSIIIPTYGKNGVELTKQCVCSIWNSGLIPPNGDDKTGRLIAEVIIVDDGSDEEDYNELESFAAENGVARILRNTPNTAHFAYNVNSGIRQSNGDIVFMMNNDIELLPGCLQTMSSVMSATNIHMAAPKLLYPDMTIQFAGMTYVPNQNDPSGHGFFDHLLRFQHRFAFGACRVAEGLLTGALLGISRAAIDTIGLLDERFELTCEDVDYSLSAMSAGLSCAYVGVAEAIHKEGATRGNTIEGKSEHPELNEKEQRSLDFLFNKWPLTKFEVFAVHQ